MAATRVTRAHHSSMSKIRIGKLAWTLTCSLFTITISRSTLAAGFDAMKTQADALLPHAQQAWNGGSSRFMNKGANGRWRDVLSPSDLARYADAVNKYFAPDLAR